jgi:hypothetical protein
VTYGVLGEEESETEINGQDISSTVTKERQRSSWSPSSSIMQNLSQPCKGAVCTVGLNLNVMLQSESVETAEGLEPGLSMQAK